MLMFQDLLVGAEGDRSTPRTETFPIAMERFDFLELPFLPSRRRCVTRGTEQTRTAG